MRVSCLHPADQLVLFMQRIYDKGLTTTSGGNLSIRDAEGNIWITPAGVDKGALTRGDITCVRPDGACVGPHRPSSELPFHASIYRMRPDLRAVLHAHPPALVAFSVVRRLPELDLVPFMRRICPEARIVPYALPGSGALGEKISAVFAGGCDIALLDNHGVCVGAPDLSTAFSRFETFQSAAQLELLARRLGPVRPLPQSAAQSAASPQLEELAPCVPATEELALRRDMIAMVRRSCRTGLFSAAHGTCSVRLSGGGFLITPFGQDRAYLEESDLVRVVGGRREAGKTPSQAVRFHAQVYADHPEIQAVFQAQPPHAMAFAVADAAFDPRAIPESYVLLRGVRKLPAGMLYADPAGASRALDAAHPAALAEGDCAIVTGGSLLQTFDRLEVLETTAHALLDALPLGPVVPIPPHELAELRAAFHLED